MSYIKTEGKSFSVHLGKDSNWIPYAKVYRIELCYGDLER